MRSYVRLPRSGFLGVERKLLDAAFAIMGREPQDGAVTDQLTLPLRHGGLGLAVTSAPEACAALLAAAAMTETAMRAGRQAFRPFAGPCAPGLARAWQDVLAAAGPEGPFSESAHTLDDACIDDVLPGAPRALSRHPGGGWRWGDDPRRGEMPSTHIHKCCG